MADLSKEIANFREKVYKYFESEEFKLYIKSLTNDYFMTNYFEVFKNYCLGGKCLRAYLVSLGYKLAGGVEEQNVFLASVAYEIFETSVLAHDDIIDQSALRRGIPSMYKRLGDNKVGEARAITMGDIGFFVCYHILSNMKVPSKIIYNTMCLQSEIFLKTCCGQIKDIDLGTLKTYTEADVIDMYKNKTAYYTIIGPLQLGATLGGANKNKLLMLKEIGLKLGVLFQAKDDIIGIFGEEKTTGKSNKSDIEEGKKTVLTAHFSLSAQKHEQALFNKFYGTKKKKSVQIIKELLTNSGSLDYANKVCENNYNEAVKLIKNSTFDATNKKKLSDFAKFIFDRQK